MIKLSDLVLPAYKRGFADNLKGAGYRVFFGGKGTGKSTNIGGYESLFDLLARPWANVMFVRLNDTDNNDSTYNYITKAIHAYFGSQTERYWWFRTQPNRIIYRKTGQMFLFKGFNHPENMNGTESRTGYITNVVIDEASQIKNMDEYLMLDQSIRAPDGFPLQITFLLNPWDVNCWIARVFCEGRLEESVEYMEEHAFQDAFYPDFMASGFTKRGLYIHRSSYLCNPYLPKSHRESALFTKERAPLLYATNYMGLWGNTVGQTYPEWDAKRCVVSPSDISKLQLGEYTIGIDTGYSDGEGSIRTDGRVKSATVCELCAATRDYKKVVALEEHYWSNYGKPSSEQKSILTQASDIVDWITFLIKKYENSPSLMKGMIPVYVDCADTATREILSVEAKKRGLGNIAFIQSTKMRIRSRIYFSRQELAFGDFLVSERCPNLIREIESSKLESENGDRENLDDHALNAWEYGWCPFSRKMSAFKDFKEPI